MINETKSHYSQSVYIQIHHMWEICNYDPETWKKAIQQLRIHYSKFLYEHILTLEGDGQLNHSYLPMKYKLQSIYGDKWWKYLWQVATMNTLGMFIDNHNDLNYYVYNA